MSTLISLPFCALRSRFEEYCCNEYAIYNKDYCLPLNAFAKKWYQDLAPPKSAKSKFGRERIIAIFLHLCLPTLERAPATNRPLLFNAEPRVFGDSTSQAKSQKGLFLSILTAEGYCFHPHPFQHNTKQSTIRLPSSPCPKDAARTSSTSSTSCCSSTSK